MNPMYDHMALYQAPGSSWSMSWCLQSNLIYEVLGYWLLASGAIGFVAMGVDKARAKGGEWRVPEATLLVISLVGGSLGVAMAAVIFHHKTSKPVFLVMFLPIVVVWLLALRQIGFLGCLGSYLPR